VSIASILANHRKPDINIHMYDFGMASASQKLLRSLCTNKGCELEFIPFDKEKAKRLKISDRWPLGVFAKYWIPTYSQEHGIEKAIWLDGDTVVDGDISRLWNIDLGNNYIAGVREVMVVLAQAIVGTSHSYVPLNGGVLLFNCRKMYQDDLLSKFLQKTMEIQENSICVEQEILSIVTIGHQLTLPMEFNFQTYHKYLYGITDTIGSAGETLLASSLRSVRKNLPLPSGNILIYHYDGPFKPWTFKSIGPYTEKWYRYLRLTPFWNFKESIKEDITVRMSGLCGSAIRIANIIGRCVL
jgi:lipopolysaccharide biosynthesis glycosyltransferase